MLTRDSCHADPTPSATLLPLTALGRLITGAGSLGSVPRQTLLEATVAKKKTAARQVIHLECTEQRDTDVPGISRYATQKNKRNTPKRLELRKYNPYLRRVTLHREIK